VSDLSIRDIMEFENEEFRTRPLLDTRYSAPGARFADPLPFPRLLVSVRSPGEAIAAVAGGADLVDVKEPFRGSLGRADDAIVAAVIQVVAGRRPVSAAWGELLEHHKGPDLEREPLELSYVKWGLAGCGNVANWPELLDASTDELPEGCRPVAVAYADWQRAAAPPPADVCKFACERGWGAFLLDTWNKDCHTLLDFLTAAALGRTIHVCRDAGVPVALAGSLGRQQIETLLPLSPTWFAVRGAVCVDGSRDRAIDAKRVRELSMFLRRGARENLVTGTLG
jgi:uncharacterized protein (UPF0264 family)